MNTTQIEEDLARVESELGRRWVLHDIPSVFINRPADHLRQIIRSWWHIYQESLCAEAGKDRSRWTPPSFTNAPDGILENQQLLASLIRIREAINLEALHAFRPSSAAEESAIVLLAVITRYYQKPTL